MKSVLYNNTQTIYSSDVCVKMKNDAFSGDVRTMNNHNKWPKTHLPTINFKGHQLKTITKILSLVN